MTGVVLQAQVAGEAVGEDDGGIAAGEGEMKVAATFGGRELCLDEGIVEAHGVVIGRGFFLIVGRGGGRCRA